MADDNIKLDIQNKVATLTLNRPDALNAFDRPFWKLFPEMVENLDSSGEIRALVIASTGKHFSAGMDLSVFQEKPDFSGVETGRLRAELMRTVARYQETFNCLEAARFPVIAAVQGGCIGAGVDLISACDMRYCTEDAFFCIQEINIGMTADVGTFPRLQKVMAEPVVREMAFTGRRMNAERALKAGLINEVCSDAGTALKTAQKAAQEIASKSPLAIWGSKRS